MGLKHSGTMQNKYYGETFGYNGRQILRRNIRVQWKTIITEKYSEEIQQREDVVSTFKNYLIGEKKVGGNFSLVKLLSGKYLVT